MEENKIPIQEGMSDELKSAINYLNDHNIGLDDQLEEPTFSEEEEETDDSFASDDVEEDDSDVEPVEFSDDIEEEEVGTEEIDNLF